MLDHVDEWMRTPILRTIYESMDQLVCSQSKVESCMEDKNWTVMPFIFSYEAVEQV